MTENTMPMDRTEYQRAYYERTKEAKKAKRKKQPRTAAAIAAEERYREKRRLLQEIAAMPVPTIDA
jgi:hypothetical protein